MTPDRLRTILDTLNWTPTSAARQLGCQPKVVRRWLGFDPLVAQMPDEVSAWFESLYDCHRLYPPPRDWKRRT